ncbi:hypothetical protein [Enhydrobacter aerosaccus]|uniref:hypothetical protein n=1 Tax=Enhydrobacter aerosaccus TaxID=225324 RepID=UPI001116CC05|nr:hypothetical protein [Enhydrobacter aerosaccus]
MTDEREKIIANTPTFLESADASPPDLDAPPKRMRDLALAYCERTGAKRDINTFNAFIFWKGSRR